MPNILHPNQLSADNSDCQNECLSIDNTLLMIIQTFLSVFFHALLLHMQGAHEIFLYMI